MIGSPLDMHDESGLAAIQKVNLLEEFKNKFRPGADKKIIANECAEIFLSDHILCFKFNKSEIFILE